MEIISDHLNKPEELMWIEHIARVTGRTVTALVTPGTNANLWEMAERLEHEGIHVRPQVGARPASVLMSLDGTLNPMRQFPAYRDIQHLPIEEQQRRLLDPEFRARALADETTSSRSADANKMVSTWHRTFGGPFGRR